MRSRSLVIALLAALVLTATIVAAQTAEYATKVLATSATLIFSNQNPRAYKVLVRNTSAVSIYVGRSNATTTTNSFRIDSGDAASFVVPAGDGIYGLVATGTQEIYYAASLY